MWHGVVWLVIGCLMALWSLALWALHAVAQWGAGLADEKATNAANGLAEAANPLAALKPPEWLAVWLPTVAQEQWGAMVTIFTPWIEYALTLAPSLVAWLVPAIWLLWALGGVVLLGLGGGLSALILVTKRRRYSTAIT